MPRLRIRFLLATALVAATSAACTSILGDFSLGAAASSPDASEEGGQSPDAASNVEGGDSAPAPGTFTASVSPSSVILRPGATAQVTVAVQRSAFDAPISVTASGLPAHVTAAAATISSPPAAQTATITLTADATANAGDSAQASFTTSSGTTTVSAGTVTVTVAGPSGTLDPSWPKKLPFGAGLGTINSALVQPDGKLVLFGTFHAMTGDAPSL